MVGLTILAPGLAIAGLACMAIPILIHLLSRRTRPPIPWAAMRFVLQAWQARRRRLRLQQIILMVIRCLIPIVLGLALAQPFLSETRLFSAGGRSLHLLIDNSMTSGLLRPDGRSSLAHHQDLAIERIKSMPSGSEISVTLLADAGNRPSWPPARDHDRILSSVSSITMNSSPVDLGGRLRDIAGYVEGSPGRDHEVLVISDFREGVGRVEESLPPSLFADGSVNLTFTRPALEEVDQIRIVDVQPIRRVVLRKGGVENLASQSLVTLVRDGSRLPEITSELRISNQSGLSTTRPVEWLAGQQEIVIDVTLPVGDQWSIDEVDPILVSAGTQTPAQERYVSVEVEDVLRVVMLDRETTALERTFEEDAGSWIRRALKPAEELPIEIRTIDPAAIMDADAVDTDAVFILRPDLLQEEGWKTIAEFRTSGGMVVVMPPGDRDVHSWMGSMLEALDLEWVAQPEHLVPETPIGVQRGEVEDSILEVLGSELDALLEPVTISRILPVEPGPAAATALRTTQGLPVLISETTPGRGTVVFVATAPRLDWTSLPSKPLMVPLVQELLRGGIHLSRGNQEVTVGDPEWKNEVTFSSGDLRHPGGRSVFVDPEDTTPGLELPGVWTVHDDRGNPTSLLVANVDPRVGDADPQSEEAISKWLGETGTWSPASLENARGINGGGLVWALLGLLLVLLVLESLLARLFSPRSSRPEIRLAGDPS